MKWLSNTQFACCRFECKLPHQVSSCVFRILLFLQWTHHVIFQRTQVLWIGTTKREIWSGNLAFTEKCWKSVSKVLIDKWKKICIWKICYCFLFCYFPLVVIKNQLFNLFLSNLKSYLFQKEQFLRADTYYTTTI